MREQEGKRVKRGIEREVDKHRGKGIEVTRNKNRNTNRQDTEGGTGKWVKEREGSRVDMYREKRMNAVKREKED